jgi:hypothetical protein
MKFLRSALLAVFLASFLWITLLVLAQQNPSQLTPEQEEAAAKMQQKGELMALVKKQFGPDLEIADTPSEITVRYLHPDKKKDAEWQYFFTGDIDGDGVEDAVIITRYKNPLARQTQFNYKVVDPYFSYHGYGNPKVTAEFQSEDPRYNHMILVIHGAGKDAWRADVPKMKFVIINLPFDRLLLAPIILNKKKGTKVMAIMAEETDGGTSSVYWDGKKYKWAEGAGNP